jgi:hypothetical protein
MSLNRIVGRGFVENPTIHCPRSNRLARESSDFCLEEPAIKIFSYREDLVCDILDILITFPIIFNKDEIQAAYKKILEGYTSFIFATFEELSRSSINKGSTEDPGT